MSENIKHLNDENFASSIEKGVVFVDFFADWCGPCRMITPIVEQLASEMKGKATFAKVDIEAAQEVTANFNVTSIPTLIIFKEGKEVKRFVGVKDKTTLEAALQATIG